MVKMNNNRLGRKNCDRVIGRLPPHVDREQRFIVMPGDPTLGRKVGRSMQPVAAPLVSPRNQMVTDVETAPTVPPMNRAQRRREEANRRK